MKIGKDTRETLARLGEELASGDAARVRDALLPTGFVLALGGAADGAVAIWRHALNGPLALPPEHPQRAMLQHVYTAVCAHLGPERAGGALAGLDARELVGFVATMDVRMREAMTRDAWTQYPAPGAFPEEEVVTRMRAQCAARGIDPETILGVDELRALNLHRRALTLSAVGGEALDEAVGLFDGVLAHPVDVLGSFVETGARLLSADAAFHLGREEEGRMRLRAWYRASELPAHELSMVFGLRTLAAAVVAGALAEEVRLDTVDADAFGAALLSALRGAGAE